MAIGTYGQRIECYIPSSEINSLVDITYAYHEKRTYDSLSDASFKQLESSILTPSKILKEDDDKTTPEVLPGMYDLQLPISVFNKKGYYTVYIKPKEIKARIMDVSNLTAYPNIRGIVLDTTQIEDENIQAKARTNNGLVGYRVIYLDNGKRRDDYRIITSNNRCEPVIQAPNSSSDKSYTYRYEDSSSLTFMTLSPSSAPSFKNNAVPYLGKVAQDILLVNTLFEPIAIDIEMVSHDIDTLSYMVENSQLRDLDNGLITTFNDNGEIYNQSEHYTLKDEMTGTPVFEVKKKRENNIDFSQSIDDK